MKRALLSFSLIMLATSATAQRAPSSLGVDRMNPPTLDQLTTYREMNECQMRPNIAAAQAMLAATTLAEANRHSARFRWRACSLRKNPLSSMKVEPDSTSLDILRWMSAEYLLVRDPQLTASLAPRPRQPAYARPWFAASARADAIDAMAACVADIDPKGILALNETYYGSAEEAQSFAALAPSLTACLESGVTLNGNRKALRGALLDALYQRARTEAAPR